MLVREVGEFGLVERIKEVVGSGRSSAVIQGIGDDCAVIKSSGDPSLLVTSDILIEDVHFSSRYFDFYDVGWRAMAANLSDIAAMGGDPGYATVCLCLSPEATVESVEALYRGMVAVADKFEVVVVGGDTAQSEEKCAVALTVIGESQKGGAALRSGAQPGDAIYVTGDLGRAEAGHRVLKHDLTEQKKFEACIQKHLRPLPRINEGRAIVQNYDLHAMMDISDGLSSEVHHICKASQVGARIYEDRIPIHPETKSAAGLLGDAHLNYALNGGEDFELLFTASSEIESDLAKQFRADFECDCTKIGEIWNLCDGVDIELSDRGRQALIPKGYDHFC